MKINVLWMEREERYAVGWDGGEYLRRRVTEEMYMNLMKRIY
jgi:hypothetical protein